MKYDVNYSKIPEHMREGTKRYLEHGIIPGRFLTAILENNLVGSIGFADEINKHRLVEWAEFLYHEMPMESWGSEKKVRKWSEERAKETK